MAKKQAKRKQKSASIPNKPQQKPAEKKVEIQPKQPEKPNFGITIAKEQDFSEWYTQLVQKAELADIRYGIKGFIVYRPWAVYTIKKMYQMYEDVLERKGHVPLIFPSLIPEKNLKLEGEHVLGFTPEVFWVTESGAGDKFEEKYALRPTSETAMYQMYSMWIRSHQDLPFKGYQSCQVWRCEGKSTRPFLRAREFHWIEAHDVFATEKEAEAQVVEDMQTTKEVMGEKFAIPFIFFQRPEWDKFPGAVHTYAADALMDSGKVLQLPSTHLLGQNFSKPFNVKFIDKNGIDKFAYITCYGPAISRIYGAMIILHSDNKGLRLPFDLAPIQVVIVPILVKEHEEQVMKKCKEIQDKLIKEGYIVKLDDSDNKPGWKFNQWEMKGVPIRIDVGPIDMAKKQITVFRRDLDKKFVVKENVFISEMDKIRKTFTKNLVRQMEEHLKGNIASASSLEGVKQAIERGKMVKVNFCSIDKAGTGCAEVIEKDVGAFVRGKRMDVDEKPSGKCIVCKKKAEAVVYIARSY